MKMENEENLRDQKQKRGNVHLPILEHIFIHI